MAFFLRYSVLALLKLFQWAPLLATLDPFSSIQYIDGDSTVLERHNLLWLNPPANHLPAGFASSNRSSCVSAHDHNSPPSSSTFTYALLISQHKHYLSNFVDSLALLYSDQLIYLNSVALNLGLLGLYYVTRLQPNRNPRLRVPSWERLKTVFHSNSESLSAATSRELSGTGEFADRTESVCATPNQEVYNSDSGSLVTRQDILRAPKKYTLHDDLDSPEIQGAASNSCNSRFVLPHETSNNHRDTKRKLNQESGSCHGSVVLDVSRSLKSLSSADLELVVHNAKPSDPCPPPLLVHLVCNSPPLVEAVSHEKARTHDTHWPARKRDDAPHEGNLQTVIPARSDHGGHLSVSRTQASFSLTVPKKRSWSYRAALGTSDDSDPEEDGDLSFEEESVSSKSPRDQLALGLSLPQSNTKNENHVTLRLSPSTSRRDNIIEHGSLCHSEPAATPFDMHRRSASTPVPSSTGSQHSSNEFVVTKVERDDSPSSGSERKFDGPDSFWEAAVQERLRVTATFTTLKPLKPKGARPTLLDLPRTAAADGDRPDGSPSSGSAVRSPPWTIITRKTPCAYSSPQQPNSDETQNRHADDDLVPKPVTPGLASNQADRYSSSSDHHRCSFSGLTLRSGSYAKYRMRFGSSSPLETRSRSSALSPWSPFAPHEFLSPTSEAVAWKRGALFLPNPPPDEFAHIDGFGNEKSWHTRANRKTAAPYDWLSGPVTEKHVAGKRAVKDSEEGWQLNAHTSLQQHCHGLWKNGHRRCETFRT
ncbi:hypothetical protein EDB19DRAFT_1701538 [Suillus lakei]|nr:hypothetical protein EDB19DRAFT_1701538 [Suillus lakei]